MSKKVMVVDDSSSIRKAVKLNLARAGYDVIEASDGQDAMEKVAGEKLNLIICDVNMPKMDGLTFVRQLKQKEEFRFTPVIMLTTVSQKEKKEEGISAGVKAWLVKPFEVEQLMSAVARLIV